METVPAETERRDPRWNPHEDDVIGLPRVDDKDKPFRMDLRVTLRTPSYVFYTFDKSPAPVGHRSIVTLEKWRQLSRVGSILGRGVS